MRQFLMRCVRRSTLRRRRICFFGVSGDTPSSFRPTPRVPRPAFLVAADAAPTNPIEMQNRVGVP